MKKVTLRIVVILILTIISGNIVKAQNTRSEMIRLRAAQKAGQFTDHISYIADKQNSNDLRKRHIQNALSLFVRFNEGNGKYRYPNMQVTSTQNKRPRNIEMSRYLNNLYNLNYSNVIIESTEWAEIEVSDLQHLYDNVYTCTASFDQAFCGYREGKAVYKDITSKTVTIYIFEERTPNGYEYIVYLGDVEATHTEKL